MLNLARWLSRWPLWLLHLFGALLGWMAYAASPPYRRRFKEHARRAGVSRADARRAISSAGRMVVEIPRLWLAQKSADEPLAVPIQWQGEALAEAALAAGRGLLLLTPHLGCFEVTAQAFAQRFGRRAPITVMYRPARQAWLRELQTRSRDRTGLSAVPASLAGVRQMVRALRRGEAVGLLPDQVPPQGLGVWAEFFGRPAYTMTLASRLVAQTGASLLLIWGERLPAGMGYRIHVRAFDGADEMASAPPEVSAQLVNRAMEAMVRECPSQYLWGYDRFRQPRGAAADAPGGNGATVAAQTERGGR